jgi:hypothetical protein
VRTDNGRRRRIRREHRDHTLEFVSAFESEAHKEFAKWV